MHVERSFSIISVASIKPAGGVCAHQAAMRRHMRPVRKRRRHRDCSARKFSPPAAGQASAQKPQPQCAVATATDPSAPKRPVPSAPRHEADAHVRNFSACSGPFQYAGCPAPVRHNKQRHIPVREALDTRRPEFSSISGGPSPQSRTPPNAPGGSARSAVRQRTELRWASPHSRRAQCPQSAAPPKRRSAQTPLPV